MDGPVDAPRVRSRLPAVLLALCFSTGIAIDRWLGLTWLAWLGACAVFTATYLLCYLLKRKRLATCFLIAACLSVGGARHHMVWSAAARNDISLFASEAAKPVRLSATIADQPYIIPKKETTLGAAWLQSDRSICTIRCSWLYEGDKRIGASGCARLEVSGQLLHVEVGDEIEVRGRLVLPGTPRNAGEFDFRQYLRRDGIRAIVRTEHPDSVRVVQRYDGFSLRRLRSHFREECESLFTRHLSRRTVPVALALLLGSRSGMDGEVRKAFRESGTMHLLAISGLHVGILAGFLWIGCGPLANRRRPIDLKFGAEMASPNRCSHCSM